MTTTTIPTTTQELVGQVLVSTWGYDQTNIDFYLVTKATPKMVAVVKIGATRDEQGYLLPDPDVLLGEPKNKKPHFSTHGVWVNLTTYSGASLWNGKPQADTWTYGGAGH